jgi:prefoldin alpha subunit
MDQELIMRAQEMEQQAREIEQNLEIVSQQIDELIGFRETLENFNASNDKEMLSMLGKGVYARTEVKEKELFVNVGANVVVKKTPGETIEVINGQVKRLKEVRMQLQAKNQAYAQAFQELIAEIQEAQNKGNKA